MIAHPAASVGSRRDWRSVAWVAPIVLLGAVVRFWGLGFGLPYTQARPDETFIISVARAFLSGNFSPHFFDYPWLYMWGLAGVYFFAFIGYAAAGVHHSLAAFNASWPVHWEPFFLLSRGLAAVCGTATIGVVYWLGRRLWTHTTGAMAALFLSLSHLHVRESHFGTTDVAMTLLVMVSTALLIDARLRRTAATRAAVAAGLAAATKYSAVLLVVPLTLHEMLNSLEGGGQRRLRRLVLERLAKIALAFGLAFLVGVPFVITDTRNFIDSMRALVQSMQLGQGGAPPVSGWWQHLAVSLRYGIGLPLLAAGLAGSAGLVASNAATATVLFAFPLASYVVSAISKNLFFRYVLPIVPFLCLGAAWLADRVAARLAASSWVGVGSAGVRQQIASWTIAAILVAPSAYSVVQFDRIIARVDNRVVVARWVAEHVPAGSSLLQSGSRAGHAQLDGRIAEWIWDGRSQAFLLNKQPAPGRPDFILLQESPLPSETQAIVVEWLRGDYSPVQRFEAVALDEPHVYNPQDAFYVPYAGLRGVRRPGPNFTVYRRADAPMR